jgi:hypothetical protein
MQLANLNNALSRLSIADGVADDEGCPVASVVPEAAGEPPPHPAAATPSVASIARTGPVCQSHVLRFGDGRIRVTRGRVEHESSAAGS